MHYLTLILIFLFYSFATNADQNDIRLDKLFDVLFDSQEKAEINIATTDIWEIWLETNDPLIENDFKEGLELMQGGQFQESIIMFTKVIEKNPNFAEAWNKRATVYYLLGDFDSSVFDINETLKREPRHFGAMDGLGLIFIHLHKYEKAIEVYDQILKIFPYNLPTIKKHEHLMKLLSKST